MEMHASFVRSATDEPQHPPDWRKSQLYRNDEPPEVRAQGSVHSINLAMSSEPDFMELNAQQAQQLQFRIGPAEESAEAADIA